MDIRNYFVSNWYIGMERSMHPLLFHTAVWYYWLWYTFFFTICLFFVYIWKTITYKKIDFRGTRATGEKRRLVWPEMLIVIVPLYWAINIVSNAMIFMKMIEGNNGHVIINVQVSGFQWGWRYCYGDTFYQRYLNNPIKVGHKSTNNWIGNYNFTHRTMLWQYLNKMVYDLYEIDYSDEKMAYHHETKFSNYEKSFKLWWSETVFEQQETDNISEHYFTRRYIKFLGGIENEFTSRIKSKRWQHGFNIISQGTDADIEEEELILIENDDFLIKKNKDKFRLFKTTGFLVLPTKSLIRLMSTSDDITHSWAVPALGFKMDCVPGRLFCLYINIKREGIYFGQCSELCGWNHYNMPIAVYALRKHYFILWWELEINKIFSINNQDILRWYDKNNYNLINYKFK